MEIIQQVEVKNLPTTTVAYVRHTGPFQGDGAAWGYLFGTWFPSSGYQPDDQLCFEVYPTMPENGKITVDICVPVKPMW